jgi:mono/diheme cytochrome c family protein
VTRRSQAPSRRQAALLAVTAILLAAAIGGAALLLGHQWLSPASTAIDPSNPAQVALGRRLYGEQCARCHGANLEGQPDWQSRRPDGRLPAPPHDASGHTWHHPDGVLFRITRDGTAAVVGGGYESDMPGFGDVLPDAEIRAVLAFIKSTWPERERGFQESQSHFEREAGR